jgi:predicted Zn-dependent peptidase
MAYFSHIATFREMIDHIYGRINLMTDPERPHVFIKELQLYLDYLYNLLKDHMNNLTRLKPSFIDTFRENLMEGVRYYRSLIPEIREESEQMRMRMQDMLTQLETRLLDLEPVTA